MASLPSEGNKALLLNLTLMPDGLSDRQVQIIERVSGISGAYLARQLLVPESMKLHSLHYAAQAAFGWLNQHPHSFVLQQPDFLRVTNGNFGEWRDMVGIFFRAPDAPQESYYASDTPPANQTYKFWLRNRYRGPYEWDSGSFFEHLVSSRLFLQSFLQPQAPPEEEQEQTPSRFDENGLLIADLPDEGDVAESLEVMDETVPAQPDYDSMTVAEGQALFNDDMKTLLERLAIGQLLVPLDMPKATMRELDRKVGRADAAFAVGEHITYPITVEMSEQAGMYGEDHTPLDVLELQDRYERVLAETDIAALPIATAIDYFYGPERAWHVRVECEEIYEMIGYKPGTLAMESFPIRDQTGREVPAEAYSTVADVILENRPVCTAVSGPNVLDGLDGLEGFAGFLDNMFSKQPQARLDANRIAREQGWSRHAPDAAFVL